MNPVDGGDDADDPTPDLPGGTADAARDIESANRVRAGALLISSADLLEPTFARTVIYVIEHNDAGSLGVVINRMSQTAVHNVMPAWTDLAASPRALFVGGPVKQDSALCLGVIKPGADITGFEAIRPVAGRVALVDLDADPEQLETVLEGIRIFAGYAGWGIGQLDARWTRTAGCWARRWPVTFSPRPPPTCGRRCCAASPGRCRCWPPTPWTRR